MKKIKVGPSLILLVLVGILSRNFILIVNYFLALFLHELAHLWVATRNGYTLKKFKIGVFGISVDLNEKIDEKDSFKINIAGPAFNLFMCVVCMAFYWLIPTSFYYLNTFCFSNLILAIFNLLPVYPLDGGKIFRGIVKSDKVYRILDKVIRFSLSGIFALGFIFSLSFKPNFLLLLFAIFFLTNKVNKTPTMSIFKYKQNKHFDKVVILKVDENQTLFNLIKQIKSYHYTIFYVPSLNKYFDEDKIVDLSLKNQLTTRIVELGVY